MSNRVAVIFSNREYDSNGMPFPPIGTLGTVVTPLDEYGDYDVVFDDYPCPVPSPPPLPSDSWVVHKNMIVFVDTDLSMVQAIKEVEINA